MNGTDPLLTGGGETAGAARSAWLTAHGRHPWPEIFALLTGVTCAWADLDGFHAEPAPAEPPLATHLWAWSPDRMLRVRIDDSDGIAAELHLNDPGHGEPVTVTERDTTTWPPREGRVSVDNEWRGRAMYVYEVAGLMPLEFARLDGAAAKADQAGPDS
jgi:hypothetical protein